jgi:type 1 fimbria pilin
MFQKKIIIGVLALVGIFVSAQVFAHTPLCSCYDNADGTVTCEGGFSDGSSAAGVQIRVQDKNGKVLIKSKMDQDSEVTFDKPSGPYTVVFDAGEGHKVEIDGKDIVE